MSLPEFPFSIGRMQGLPGFQYRLPLLQPDPDRCRSLDFLTIDYNVPLCPYRRYNETNPATGKKYPLGLLTLTSYLFALRWHAKAVVPSCTYRYSRNIPYRLILTATPYSS